MLISHAPALLLVSRPADIVLRPQPRRLFDNRKLTAADGSAGNCVPWPFNATAPALTPLAAIVKRPIQRQKDFREAYTSSQWT